MSDVTGSHATEPLAAGDIWPLRPHQSPATMNCMWSTALRSAAIDGARRLDGTWWGVLAIGRLVSPARRHLYRGTTSSTRIAVSERDRRPVALDDGVHDAGLPACAQTQGAR